MRVFYDYTPVRTHLVQEVISADIPLETAVSVRQRSVYTPSVIIDDMYLFPNMLIRTNRLYSDASARVFIQLYMNAVLCSGTTESP